jgi:hypothetical protein
MKIRIRGHSVRVRLTRSEVARLGQGLSVEQTTQFSPSSVLRSSVQPSDHATLPAVHFDGAAILVELPKEQVREWASSDQVSIEAQQQVEPGTLLQILVEKDFECMHSKAEGNTDAFPNPRERQAPKAVCA